MKRLSVLLVIALIAGMAGGCRFALVEGETLEVSGLSARAEGFELFSLDDPDISYLNDEPLDMTPSPTPKSTASNDIPFEEPSSDATAGQTPAPTKMPKVRVTPEPTPEPTEEPLIGLHSQDMEGESKVYKLQQRLVELEYLDAEPDGIFGSRTLKALKRFQRDSGIEDTGVLDDETKKALYPAPKVTTPPEEVRYAEGASGRDIRRVHEKLRQYGFSIRPASSEYGEALSEEVMAFQQYAVENYGTEFDDPADGQRAFSQTALPVLTMAPIMTSEPRLLTGSVFDPDETPEPEARDAAMDAIPEMPVLAPEATLRPDHPLDGAMSEYLYDYLIGDRFPVYRFTVQTGDTGSEVERVQRRLTTLEYYYNEISGVYDELTQAAVKAFQQRGGLQQTGIADAETQTALFSAEAPRVEPAEAPYYIKVSIDDQRVYVYRWSDGGYNHLIKSMICSTGYGSTTPKGIFVSPGQRDARWHYFAEFHCWAQYAFIIKGAILFHSVIYSSNSEDSLRVSTLENLGRKASHGCVRLKVADAKWIYDHCGEGQVIEIY